MGSIYFKIFWLPGDILTPAWNLYYDIGPVFTNWNGDDFYNKSIYSMSNQQVYVKVTRKGWGKTLKFYRNAKMTTLAEIW